MVKSPIEPNIDHPPSVFLHMFFDKYDEYNENTLIAHVKIWWMKKKKKIITWKMLGHVDI